MVDVYLVTHSGRENMRSSIFKALNGLALVFSLAAGPVHADIVWHWNDGFSDEEQTLLASWIAHTVSAVESLVAPFPFDLHIHFHRLIDRGEPVPWANTRRGPRQGVDFHVDPSFPLESFYADWTAPHELSHLLIPSLGRDSSWFAEGFASYMQYQVMRHMGEMEGADIAAAYRVRMARAQASYRLPESPLPTAAPELRRSGDYPTYYWGGAVYFLRADTALRARGLGGLSGLLREYMACCRRREAGLAGLLQQFDELTGTSLFDELMEEFRVEPGFPAYSEALDRLEAQLQSERASMGDDLQALLDRLELQQQ